MADSVFKEIVVPTIAAVGLIQPWAVYAYRKIVQRHKIEVVPAGYIEIGYSNYGPTLGLIGTLVSTKKDAFVHSIDLKLVRTEDNLTHDLRWLFFHSPDYNLLDPRSATVKTPYSFQLQKNVPYNYSISFRDQATNLQMADILMKHANRWDDLVKNGEVDEKLLKEVRNAAAMNPLNYPAKEIFDLIEPFRNTKESNDAIINIMELNYWKAGNYNIELKLNIRGQQKPLSKKFAFRLSKEDEDQIKQNVISICTYAIIQSFGFRPMPFHFRNQSYL
jgi:hypothetical protein